MHAGEIIPTSNRNKSACDRFRQQRKCARVSPKQSAWHISYEAEPIHTSKHFEHRFSRNNQFARQISHMHAFDTHILIFHAWISVVSAKCEYQRRSGSWFHIENVHFRRSSSPSENDTTTRRSICLCITYIYCRRLIEAWTFFILIFCIRLAFVCVCVQQLRLEVMYSVWLFPLCMGNII